ncbi:MAG: carboxylesterase family protein [Ruminiclostridium sp.]|nr:carboxylesterase family protein [Ruminiclostridium sp.]
METYKKNSVITGEYDKDKAAVCVNGTFIGKENDGVIAFRGIPFAQPPVGKFRWKEPVPVTASEAVCEAYYNGSSPIQTKLDSERASLYHQSEDCLYLNVWTAAEYIGHKRAVMVFIHGGNYGWGGTADPLYDGHNFVKAHPEIVLVTIAYRVGIMGFVDLSTVPGGEAYPTAGNLGLLDQICALRYIQRNIGSFGGDPSNVTVFGESAGAGSVSLLPLIPAARGLFSKVIAESGSVALTYSKKECRKITDMLLKETGARTMRELVALPTEKLIKANEKLNDCNNFPERDGIVLPENLYEAYENGESLPVSMMIGSNADELRYWIQDVGGITKYRIMSRVLFNAVIKQMKDMDRRRIYSFLRYMSQREPHRTWRITELFNELLFRLPAIRQGQAHAAHGNPVYMYYWKYPSAIPYMGACHAVELAYVFNNLNETIYTGDNIDPALAALVQQMWVNFAVSGDPSADGLEWETYSAESRKTMVFDTNSHIEEDLNRRERRTLMPLLDYRINGNYIAAPVEIPESVKLGAAAAGIGIAMLALWLAFRK